MLLQATKDVLAMASLEVDLANVQPGNTITVKWRGKPVFVRHRTEEEIGKAQNEDISHMRDPQNDQDRTQKPEVSTAAMTACCSPTAACTSTYAGDMITVNDR